MHRVDRVLSFLSSRRNNRDSPPPFLGGGHTHLGERGWGVPIPTRRQRLWYSRYICILWSFGYFCTALYKCQGRGGESEPNKTTAKSIVLFSINSLIVLKSYQFLKSEVHFLNTFLPMLRVRIRIHRIPVFLASWIRIRILSEVWIRIRLRILLSLSKYSKKNLDFYCFVTSFWLFIVEKLYKCTFKK